jgi:hypothetical protein
MIPISPILQETNEEERCISKKPNTCEKGRWGVRLKHGNYWKLWCKYCAKEFKAKSIIGVTKMYLSMNGNNILLCVLLLEDLQICKMQL